MARYLHPRALDAVRGYPPSAVWLGRSRREIAGDGTFQADPQTDRVELQALARNADVSLEDLRVSGSDDETAPSGPSGGAESDGGGYDTSDVKASIDDGLCPFCGNAYAAVPQHAAQAHPDEWDEYKAERGDEIEA